LEFIVYNILWIGENKMDFEKKNNIYKVIMLMLLTAFVTFLITLYGVCNYYIKSDKGKAEILSKNVTISDTSKDVQTKIELVKSYIDQYYLGQKNEGKMEENAIKGYVAGLGDPYTVYLTSDEYKDLMIDVNGNYVGIGVYMSADKDRKYNCYKSNRWFSCSRTGNSIR